MAKSIGNSYNLRNSSSNNASPTNFNTVPVPNQTKLVRYKNTSNSPQQLQAQYNNRAYHTIDEGNEQRDSQQRNSSSGGQGVPSSAVKDFMRKHVYNSSASSGGSGTGDGQRNSNLDAKIDAVA